MTERAPLSLPVSDVPAAQLAVVDAALARLSTLPGALLPILL